MFIRPKVVVAVPTLRSNPRTPMWIDALSNLQFPLGSAMGRLWSIDERIDVARNQLLAQAIASEAEYLFFLGDDVIIPDNTILTMLDKISKPYAVGGRTVRADMITGIYWTRDYPTSPYIWRGMQQGPYKDWKAGEFFPVDFAGCDCLLISLDALKRVPQPWFKTDWTWKKGQKPPALNTEDFYFYTKARRHGLRVFADTSLQCLHEERKTGMLFSLTTEMPQAAIEPPIVEGEGLLVADLGAGLSTPFFGKDATVVRFDMREEVKPDFRCDIAHLPENQFGKYDVVHLSHVLEHFRREEAPGLIRHWTKLLKVGGKVVIGVPDFEVAVKNILAGPPAVTNYDWAMIYGDQAADGPPWEHRNGFTARKLEMLLRTHPCLGEIEVKSDPREGCTHNLLAFATLLREDVPEDLESMWDEIDRIEGRVAAATGEGNETSGESTS